MAACKISYKEGSEQINLVRANNGERSALFDNLRTMIREDQVALETYAETYTKPFKQWISGSKALDGNNEPMLFSSEEQPDYLAGYRFRKVDVNSSNDTFVNAFDGKKSYLNVKNPKKVDNIDNLNNDEIIEILKTHDGITDNRTYIVAKENQSRGLTQVDEKIVTVNKSTSFGFPATVAAPKTTTVADDFTEQQKAIIRSLDTKIPDNVVKEDITLDQLTPKLRKIFEGLDSIQRYVIVKEDGTKKIIMNRPSDAGQELFIQAYRKRGLDPHEFNNSDTNIIKRGMGTTGHWLMENIINYIDSFNKDNLFLEPGKEISRSTFIKNRQKLIQSMILGKKSVDKNTQFGKALMSFVNDKKYTHHLKLSDLIQGKTGKELEDMKGKVPQDFTMNNTEFENLVDLGLSLYHQIYETQAIIDWESDVKHKPVIRTEQLIYDAETDYMGSIDLIAVFSNGKVANFDYKFVALGNKYGDDATMRWTRDKNNVSQLEYVDYKVKESFRFKKDSYDAQIGKYKDILTKIHGIDPMSFVQSRIVPINTVFDTKKEKDGKVTLLPLTKFIDHKHSLLRQIPLSTELSGDAKLDAFLSKLFKERQVLQFKLQNRKTDEKLRDALEELENNIKVIQLDKDIKTVAENVIKTAESFDKLLTQPLYITDKDGNDVINPKYLDEKDLHNLEDLLSLYQGLRDASHHYLEKSKEHLKKKDYDEMKMSILRQNEVTSTMMQEIGNIRQSRLAALANEKKYTTRTGKDISIPSVSKVSVDQAGFTNRNNFSNYKDVGTLGRWFNSLSDYNIDHFKILKDILDDVNADVRDFVEKVQEKIKVQTENLTAWGKQNGRSGLTIFTPLINSETGKLRTPFKKEFYKKRDEAIKDGNIEWLKDNLVFDEDKFLKSRAQYESILKREYKDDDIVKEKMTRYDNKFDMRLSDSAWYIKDRKFWDVKDKEKWYSDEWKYIEANKPLREYYDMYVEFNQLINIMVGDKIYVGDNFVANVQKDTVDILSENGIFSMDNVQDIKNVMSTAFSMRSDDDVLGTNMDNEIFEQVPIRYFANDVPGGIKNKSFDLSKNMLLFLYTAKMHEAATQIEGIAEATRRSLANTKLLRVDDQGKIIEGEYIEGKDSKLYESLDSYIKFYLYGQKTQSEDRKLLGKYSSIKIAQTLIGFFSKKNLAWSRLPLIAGHLNAKAQIHQIASAEKFFTKKQHLESETEFKMRSKKAGIVSHVFELQQEGISGLIYEKANKLSPSSLRSTYNKSLAYIWQRRSEDAIDETILYSYLKNNMLHPNGRDVIPRRNVEKMLKGTKWEGTEFKSIWNQVQPTDTNADTLYTLDGQEGGFNRDQYIKIRNQVKRIAAKVKGNMDKENIPLYKTSIFGQALMQYRGWIPAMAMERWQDPKYDHTLDQIEIGRWRVGLGEILGNGLSPALKNFAKTTLTLFGDAITFNSFNFTKPDKVIAKRYFNEWRSQNPADFSILMEKFGSGRTDEEALEAAFEDWIDTRKDALKSLAAEIRMYAMIAAAMMSVGFMAGDDERDKHPAVRELVRILNRTSLEIGFFFIPKEFMQVVTRSPIPVLGMINDARQLISNTVEETSDWALGAPKDKTINYVQFGDSPWTIELFEEASDRTPPGKYMFRFIPAVKGITDWLEITEQAKERETMWEWLFGVEGEEKIYK